MKKKTKIYTIAAIISFLLIVLVVYLHINHLINEYGDLGLIGGMMLYTCIFGAILYAYLSYKYPRRRTYREPRYNERIDVVHHYEDNRPPRRRPYHQDDRISPMYQKRAENYASHKWDVVDNYGYFGKKKKGRY